MKTNQKTRIFAMITAAALMTAPFASTAFALSTWTLSTSSTDRTWNMPTNDSTWTNAKIINVEPSDKTILTTTLNGTNSFTINPLKEGSTNVTITYYTTNVAETKTQIQPVTVSNSSTGSSTSSTVTFTTLNTDQTPVSQYLTGLGTVVSQNTNVATVSLNASGQLVVRSVGAGSTNIVGSAQMIGGQTYAVNLAVNVNTNTTTGTTSNGVVVNGMNVTIPKGQTWQVPGSYYIISGSSSATTVATAVPTGNAGSMVLNVNGLTPGTSTITGTKMATATTAAEGFTYTITVTDTAAATTTPAATGTTTALPGTKLAAMTLSKAGAVQSTAASTFAQIEAGSIKSDHPTIATAEIVGTQVKVKGISAGSTHIGFRAQTTGGTMADYVIPVTVGGTGTASTGGGLAGGNSSTSSYEISDVVFKKDSYTLAKSTKKAYVLKGMMVEGETVAASDLLWVSNNTGVVTVNSKTGTFRVLKNSGSARLIAVDSDGEAIGSVIINAK